MEGLFQNYSQTGKYFPYECNGALQNNLKLQILATFQRLKGYSGLR